MSKIIKFPGLRQRERRQVVDSLRVAFENHDEPFRSDGISDMLRVLDLYVPDRDEMVTLPSWVTPEQAEDIKASVSPMFNELKRNMGMMFVKALEMRVKQATCSMLHVAQGDL